MLFRSEEGSVYVMAAGMQATAKHMVSPGPDRRYSITFRRVDTDIGGERAAPEEHEQVPDTEASDYEEEDVQKLARRIAEEGTSERYQQRLAGVLQKIRVVMAQIDTLDHLDEITDMQVDNIASLYKKKVGDQFTELSLHIHVLKTLKELAETTDDIGDLTGAGDIEEMDETAEDLKEKRKIMRERELGMDQYEDDSMIDDYEGAGEEQEMTLAEMQAADAVVSHNIRVREIKAVMEYDTDGAEEHIRMVDRKAAKDRAAAREDAINTYMRTERMTREEATAHLEAHGMPRRSNRVAPIHADEGRVDGPRPDVQDAYRQ